MIQNQLAAPGEKDGDWTILASVIHSLCKSNFITMKLYASTINERLRAKAFIFCSKISYSDTLKTE